jgi:hypothetical protein
LKQQLLSMQQQWPHIFTRIRWFYRFQSKISHFAPMGAFGGGDDKEHEVTITAPCERIWVSFRYPLWVILQD